MVQAPGWLLPEMPISKLRLFPCAGLNMLLCDQWVRSLSDDLMTSTSLVVGKERDGLAAGGNYFRFCAAWMSFSPPAPLSGVVWGRGGMISC